MPTWVRVGRAQSSSDSSPVLRYSIVSFSEGTNAPSTGLFDTFPVVGTPPLDPPAASDPVSAMRPPRSTLVLLLLGRSLKLPVSTTRRPPLLPFIFTPFVALVLPLLLLPLV